jgi:hypothetical protein
MTACNIWLQPSAGHIISDGALYDPDGRIVQIASKIVISDDIGLAFMSLGRCHHTRLGEHLIRLNAASNIEALAALPDIAAALKAENVAAGQTDPDLILVALGWSEPRRAPIAFAVSTGGRQALGGPGELIEVLGYSTPEVALPFAITSGRLDPDANGLAALEAQRRDLALGYSIVGGFGEVTTVTAEGITKRRIVEWPDAVGNQIHH